MLKKTLHFGYETVTSDGAKVHWVAPKKDFGEALLVVLEDSTRNVFLHMSREDSSKVWISSKNGCLFPGPCPHMPLGWSALSIMDNFDFEGQEDGLAKAFRADTSKRKSLQSTTLGKTFRLLR